LDGTRPRFSAGLGFRAWLWVAAHLACAAVRQPPGPKQDQNTGSVRRGPCARLQIGRLVQLPAVDSPEDALTIGKDPRSSLCLRFLPSVFPKGGTTCTSLHPAPTNVKALRRRWDGISRAHAWIQRCGNPRRPFTLPPSLCTPRVQRAPSLGAAAVDATSLWETRRTSNES